MDAMLTIHEVAHFLKLSEATITAMVQRGEIPAEKIGGKLVFRLDVLENWLNTQLKTIQGRLASAPTPQTERFLLTHVLREEHIVMSVPGGGKEEILTALIDPLLKTGAIASGRVLLQALMARERLMSTAVGRGVAIPHPRQPMPFLFEHLAVVVGLSREGVSFAAIDGQPVHVLFLVGAPNDQSHLWALAAISNLVQHADLAEALTKCAVPTDVIRAIRAAERSRGTDEATP